MKRLLLILFLFADPAWATHYWCTTGSWSTLANWDVAANCAGGDPAALPTFADDVAIGIGGEGTTITLNGTPDCRNLDLSNFTGTFTGAVGVTLSIHGSLTLPTGAWTNTFLGPVNMDGTGVHTITCNGKSIIGNFTLNGTGGAWAFTDACIFNSGYQHWWGTGTDNGFTLTMNWVNSNSGNVRIWNYTGTWTLTVANGGTITVTSATGFTATNTPSLVDLTSCTTSCVWTGSVPTFHTVRLSNANANIDFDYSLNAETFDASVVSGGSLQYGAPTVFVALSRDLILNATITDTFLGKFTFNGTSGIQNITARTGMTSGFTFNHAGSTVRLLTDVATSGACAFTAGTMVLNNHYLQCSTSGRIQP